MSTPNAARKRLPVRPSEENLKKQAKRLAKLESIQLAESQHRLAREYGCKSWAELMHVVETMNRGADQLADVKRTVEPLPAAVRARDVAAVRAILAAGEFTQHDLDAGLAHAAWYGGDAPAVLAVRKELFDLLLDHGADPDGQYGSAYGPIIFGTGECLSPDGLQWLLDAGADVTFPPIDTKYGPQCALSTWLGTYARGDNTAKHRGVDLLIKRHAFVPKEVSPPILAIHRGDARSLGELLDADSSLLKKRFADMPYGNIELRGATLLHCAVEFGEIDCLNVLFDRYADINLKADVIAGVGGQTPIYHALHSTNSGNFPTLEYLIKRVGQWIDMSVKATWRGSASWAITGFDSTKTPLTPLEYAELAASKIDPAKAKFYPRANDEIALLRSLDRRAEIRRACEAGDVATVARMLDESPELLTGELWPATVHVGKSLAITQLLLEYGLDPNVSSAPRRAIDLAAYHSLAEIAVRLVTAGADVTTPNKLGETPLDLLDAYEPRPVGDAESQRVREILLFAGAKDDIHSAVRSGDVDLVGRMLEADPSLLETKEPWPPLSTAARSGRVEIAKLLIARGADVNARNDKHNTPLWFACQSPASPADRIAVARLLLDAGANPRFECEDQTTPLHFAASRGPIEMVELLIRHDAKEWQADRFGKKPLDHARAFGRSADREAIIELLDRPVIRDPHFRAAVNAIHAGDLPALKTLLAGHPNLVHDRAIEPDCYPPGYFRHPKLLWFIADNPNLIETMPANTVELAEAIIDAGAELADLNYTLELVLTSEPARSQGFLLPLFKLLHQRGASVTDKALIMMLGHRMGGPIQKLLGLGANEQVHGQVRDMIDRVTPLTAPIAAGLGLIEELKRLLPAADTGALHAALSLAVINRHMEAARLCLDAGAGMNEFMIVHPHSTPAHAAANNDDVEMLRLLVERGAKLDTRDKLWNGTPLGWAIHEKRVAAEAYLRLIGAP